MCKQSGTIASRRSLQVRAEDGFCAQKLSRDQQPICILRRVRGFLWERDCSHALMLVHVLFSVSLLAEIEVGGLCLAWMRLVHLSDADWDYCGPPAPYPRRALTLAEVRSD